MADVHLIHYFTGALFSSGATVEEAVQKIGEVAGYAKTGFVWVDANYRLREHMVFHAVLNQTGYDEVDPDNLISHEGSEHLGHVAIYDTDNAEWIHEAEWIYEAA
ncbi:hypothetical protein [Agrobacterium genomosp. 2]|uniref:Uncharacterized protein n=1 Tax=Agrobacterium genomosp. 2 str. CFBP 5494 TaxID=1183436 RepID=A0A9W5F0Z7_9HYPH|nr:hypothetical protein [Agrobacterium genomosp. 2]CUW93605.1 hypothetical protein AGR2A_Cc70055 [Agrobacterium genomosp. 2 str. CFBP 5494]